MQPSVEEKAQLELGWKEREGKTKHSSSVFQITTGLAFSMKLFLPFSEIIFLFSENRICHKKSQLAYEQFPILETKIILPLMGGNCAVLGINGASKFCWTEIKFQGKVYPARIQFPVLKVCSAHRVFLGFPYLNSFSTLMYYFVFQ